MKRKSELRIIFPANTCYQDGDDEYSKDTNFCIAEMKSNTPEGMVRSLTLLDTTTNFARSMPTTSKVNASRPQVLHLAKHSSTRVSMLRVCPMMTFPETMKMRSLASKRHATVYS